MGVLFLCRIYKNEGDFLFEVTRLIFEIMAFFLYTKIRFYQKEAFKK